MPKGMITIASAQWICIASSRRIHPGLGSASTAAFGDAKGLIMAIAYGRTIRHASASKSIAKIARPNSIPQRGVANSHMSP